MPIIYAAYKRISDKNLIELSSGEDLILVRDLARNSKLVKNHDEIIVTKSSQTKLAVLLEKFFVHRKEEE